MIEKESFIRPIDTDLYVATIGINRDDWYCHKPGMTRDEVRRTMIQEGFDVVPIVDKEGVFKKYFTLNKTDKVRLDFNDIKTDDRLYYLCHVRDAIWKMKSEQRTHYFLSNGRSENDIVGLLSISNYNCREFYVFLFSLISYVEREFAGLIKNDIVTGLEILTKRSHTEELRNQLLTIQQRINKDKENNIENDYKEYLYLHHLIWLVMEEKKFEAIGYKNAKEFETGTSGLKDIRNNVAHPVRSLVRTIGDLNKLYIGLNKLYEFKERLDDYLKRARG